MARINIEDSIFGDLRLINFSHEIGSTALAIGNVILAWRLAQKFWSQGNKNGIPKCEFISLKLHPGLITNGLAEDRGDFIYMKGSIEQFAWLDSKRENGKRGGRPKKPNVEIIKENGKLRKATESYGNPLTLTLSLTPKEKEDISRTDEKISQKSLSANALPHLGKLWNNNCGNLPKVIAANSSRRRLAETRWRDNPIDEYWINIIKLIVSSPFCNGQNDRGWRANFDFLIKPETQNKVLEGKYNAKGSKPMTIITDITSLDERRSQ